jgi:hypothetical protein
MNSSQNSLSIPENSKIYIFRFVPMESLINTSKEHTIYIDGVKQKNIKQNRYIIISVDSGQHKLAVKRNGEEILEKKDEFTQQKINLKAGETYYFTILPFNDPFKKTRYRLAELTKEESRSWFALCLEQE